jgi:dimeric dUTPase (all-alpha-NTP-PPase superfamily)
MEQPDQFRELFRMQRALNERIGVRTEGMSVEDKTKWLLNYCRAMSQEIAELTDSVPWKWWAKYQKFDDQNARVEVVDLFHFLISLAQVLGMSADDVFNATSEERGEFKRQEPLHREGRARFHTSEAADCGRRTVRRPKPP